MTDLTRRGVLALASLGAASIAFPQLRPKPTSKRALRVAHLTDIHVQPEKDAPRGMAAALHHAQSQKDKPDLLLTGGDQIMDAFGADYDRTKTQWEVFSKVLKAENSLPVEHCIGNHDVWGFSKREDNPQHAVRAGKKWACEVLGLEKPYRSFDRGGWHFIVLDSTHPAPQGSGYIARLDDEQFQWLEQDLARTPSSTPVVVVSHIPIISACGFFDGNNEKTGEWILPASWMHVDARRIKDLFVKHPNVKLALSGHMHQLDFIQFNGVTYYCSGAVCGAWWAGKYYECEAGYGLIDLYEDGSVACEYVLWGWKPSSES
jgi:3',5'-cyclic AMP phosphodiesterase CpdA